MLMPEETDEGELKRKVVQAFVKSIGGGKGNYKNENKENAVSSIFVQEHAPEFPSDLFPTVTSTNFGLGFGQIKFADNDHAVPYVRVPWKNDDKFNALRAQVSIKKTRSYF
jgi:hypothetical protein